MPTFDGAHKQYPQIVRAMSETPWAMLPSAFSTLVEVIGLRVAGGHFSEEEIEQRIDAGPGRGGGLISARGVAVLPIYGTIIPRATMMSKMSGGTALTDICAALDQIAADDSIGAVLLDVNSPGGSVDLVPETAAKIRALAEEKRVVAISNTTAASAAYWLASQATELVVTPSGSVGSIGVFAAHEDHSVALEMEGVDLTLVSAGRYKVELSPFAPLAEDAREAMQAVVDEFYEMFTSAVAKGRGVSASKVRNGFGEARMVTARNAVTEGMADRVDTFESTLTRLVKGGGGSRRRGGTRADAENIIEQLAERPAAPFMWDSSDEADDESPEVVAEEAAPIPDDGSEQEQALIAEMVSTLQDTSTSLKEANE